VRNSFPLHAKIIAQLSRPWAADSGLLASLGGFFAQTVGFHFVLQSTPGKAKRICRLTDVAPVFSKVLSYHLAFALAQLHGEHVGAF
jgi:hypothetical protein